MRPPSDQRGLRRNALSLRKHLRLLWSRLYEPADTWFKFIIFAEHIHLISAKDSADSQKRTLFLLVSSLLLLNMLFRSRLFLCFILFLLSLSLSLFLSLSPSPSSSFFSAHQYLAEPRRKSSLARARWDCCTSSSVVVVSSASGNDDDEEGCVRSAYLLSRAQTTKEEGIIEGKRSNGKSKVNTDREWAR